MGKAMSIRKEEPIKDKELDLYLRTIYPSKLEEELLKTGYGRRIKELENLGIGISIEDVIEKYQERNGYTVDNVGNIKIEEDSIGEIYKENIAEASKRIGFDISGLDAKQISQVLNQLEYVQDVKDIKIDGRMQVDGIIQTNQKENNLFAICEKLNIPESEYSLDTNSMKLILSSLKISNEQAENYVESYKKSTIDSFLATISDAKLMRYLSRFAEILENKSDDKTVTYLPAEIEAIQMMLDSECFDSKFIKDITDENGKFDWQKGLKFFKDFQKKREESDLVNKINKYMTKKKLSESDEKGLTDVFVVAFSRGDAIHKKQVIAIAQANGIDILDKNGNLDKSKIEEFGKKTHGKDFSFEKTLEKNTFAGQVAWEKLSEIENCIARGDTIENPSNAEEANAVKQKSKENEKRICGQKEQIVYQILNSPHAATPIDFYKNPKNAKGLIFLYCKFRNEEANINHPERKQQITKKLINSEGANTVSGILKKFMKEHEDAFGEYFMSDGDLDVEKVMNIMQEDKLTVNGMADNLVIFEQIKKKTDNIEKLAKINGNKKKLTKIDTLLSKSKDELLDDEKEELYSIAKETPLEIISTECLEKLKELDLEKFNEVFKGKKVVRNVGKDSLGAIYFSAARLFVKGVYALPKMLISKKAREEYMPKIKRHIVSGSKRLANLTQNNEKGSNDSDEAKKPKFGFPNIFRKNKQKKLEAGVPVNSGNSDRTSQVPTDKISTNQQTFEERYGIDNQNNQVEAKAAETAEAAIKISGENDIKRKGNPETEVIIP